MAGKRKKLPIEGGPTHTYSHRIYRFVWNLSWTFLCSWTPAFLWRWRVLVLRAFGARIGHRCDVRGTAKVWYPPNLIMADSAMLADGVICYNVSNIILHEGALVSQRAFLCTASHDVDRYDFKLKSQPIVIGRRCWIAAEAFVGPGVNVGDGAVLAARAATFKNLDEWSVYRGNPATFIRSRTRFAMPKN